MPAASNGRLLRACGCDLAKGLHLGRPLDNRALLQLLQADASPLVKQSTTSLAAHDLYLKGLYVFRTRTADALAKATTFFQKAIKEDPTYALAYVGLATSTAVLIEYGSVRAAEALPKAKQAALRALELDGSLAEAHAVSGVIHDYDFEWAAAEREYLRAIELKPGYPTAHHWYAVLLIHQGRGEEALAEVERARELDPTSLVINVTLVEAYYVGRQYDRAIAQAKKTLELDPDFPLGHSFLALALLGQDRYADAVAELEKLRGPSLALPSRYAGELGYAYAMSGRRADALRVLAELEGRSQREHVSPTARALIYMGLGNKDQSFVWLEKAYAEREWRMRQLKANPLWDSLRSDPRFTRLLKNIHLD